MFPGICVYNTIMCVRIFKGKKKKRTTLRIYAPLKEKVHVSGCRFTTLALADPCRTHWEFIIIPRTLYRSIHACPMVTARFCAAGAVGVEEERDRRSDRGWFSLKPSPSRMVPLWTWPGLGTDRKGEGCQFHNHQ